jgi:hypothetical protein
MGSKAVAKAMICPQTCSAPGITPERTICWQAARMLSTPLFTGMIPLMSVAIELSLVFLPGRSPPLRFGRGGSGAAAGEEPREVSEERSGAVGDIYLRERPPG